MFMILLEVGLFLRLTFGTLRIILSTKGTKMCQNVFLENSTKKINGDYTMKVFRCVSSAFNLLINQILNR